MATTIDDNAADEKSDKSIWRLLNIRCTSSKLALNAHKVLSTPNGTGACRCAFKAGGKKIRMKYFRHPDGKCLVCNIWYDGKTVRECIKSCQRCSMRERRWLFIGGRSFWAEESGITCFRFLMLFLYLCLNLCLRERLGDE